MSPLLLLSVLLSLSNTVHIVMLYYITLLCLFGDSPSSAAPLPVNITALHTEIAEPWTPNPSGRGTWTLLYSCVFTLVLCVWTSIHLNVPPQGDTAWNALWRKLKWVLIALFAPEIVVFVAFQQWLTVLTFKRELDRLAKEHSKEIERIKLDLKHRYQKYRRCEDTKELAKKREKEEKKPAFDLFYAYFVAMGGFVINIGHLHNSLQRATVTPNGILLLASQGKFFHPSVKTIKDKSKANVLAKLLVCVQVLWIAGQTLERWIADYPLTLLEIYTIVHVVCALTMYLLWFQKPFDVEDPTTIPSEDIEDILAFMVTSTRWKKDSGFENSKFSDDPPFHWYRNWALVNVHIPIVEDLPTSPIPQEDNRVTLLSDQAENVEVVTYLEAIKQGDNEPLVYSVKDIQCTYTPIQQDVYCTLVSGQALESGLGPAVSYKPPRTLDGTADTEEAQRENTNKSEQENINEKSQRWANNLRNAYRHFQKGYRLKYLNISDPSNCKVSLSEIDTQRLKLASAFIAKLIESANSSDAVTETQETSDTETREHLTTGSPSGNVKPNAFPTDQPFDPFTNNSLQRYGNRLLSIRERNWSGFLDLLDSLDYFGRSGVAFMGFLIAAAFSLIPGAYGSVHFAALSVMFPSDIEKLLWKISCYVLLGSAALLPAVVGLVIVILIPTVIFWGLGSLFNHFTRGWFYRQLEESWSLVRQWLERQLEAIDNLLEPKSNMTPESGVSAWANAGKVVAAYVVAFIGISLSIVAACVGIPLLIVIGIIGLVEIAAIPAAIFVYVGSRLFIVVEAFISLRRVPTGVYETPYINFMDYVPHF